MGVGVCECAGPARRPLILLPQEEISRG
uniref:Uncharacterized protein n=1 Tax=Arundo donax TaxID=35708 RepID=A0A0A9FPE7_ARUDO